MIIKAPFSFFKYCFSHLLALPIGTKPDIAALKWNADKKTQNKSVKVLFSCWWNCVCAPAWVHEVAVAKIFPLKSLYFDLQHDIFEIEAQRDHFHSRSSLKEHKAHSQQMELLFTVWFQWGKKCPFACSCRTSCSNIWIWKCSYFL